MLKIDASWRARSRLAALSLLVSSAAPATLLADGAASLPTYDRVMLMPAPKPIADFELTDQDGRNFRFSSLHGEPALLLFGYAHCPDVCPLSLQKLKLLKDSKHELKDVKVVMVSVDAERDSAAALKEFMGHFSGEFIGLTGDPQRIREIATQFSAAFFKADTNPATGNYPVGHSGQVFAIDKAGNLRAEFYDADLEAMAGITRALLAE
jgi:protein SCO1/2